MEENVFYTDRDIEREANRELSSKSEFTLNWLQVEVVKSWHLMDIWIDIS